MVENGELVSALFLGFSDAAPVNTKELTFYDLFVMQASIMLKKLIINNSIIDNFKFTNMRHVFP